MKVISCVVFLAAAVLAKNYNQTTDHEKKLLTFHEALHQATHNNSHYLEQHQEDPHHQREHHHLNHTSTPHNKVYFEVIRIHERLMVDQKNVTKGYNANLHTALYTIESGHLKRLFVRDLKVIPKPGSPLLKAIKAQRFLANNPSEGEGRKTKPLPGSDDSKNFFDEWYRKLHLNEPIPAFIAAVILGFFATLVIYGTAYGLLLFFYKVTGYQPVDDEQGFIGNNNNSEEQLLRQEQKRMEEAKPLISKA